MVVDIFLYLFKRKKSEAVNDFMAFYNTMVKKHHKTVKFIRCDNSGENKLIAKIMGKKYLTFNFNSPLKILQNKMVK